MNREMLDKIGERIDRLVTLDIRGRGPKCPVMDLLYPVARGLYNRPISAYAAEKLADTIQPGDRVFLVTGMACYGLAPETDGPPGATALARALQIGLKANPVFITHELFTGMLKRTIYGGGFLAVEKPQCWDAWKNIPSGAVIEGFPVDDKSAVQRADELLDYYNPRAIIAVEARGQNRDGEYHVVDGTNVTAKEAKLGRLFDKAKRKNILSVGIFDGCGHEIGFGTIAEEAGARQKRYTKCSCGCPSGMVDSNVVDIAFPAATSNWGAYGIEACLSALLRNENMLHDEETEKRMIRRCADAGGMDGLSGRAEYSVDGLPESIQTSLIGMLGQIVLQNLKGYEPGMK